MEARIYSYEEIMDALDELNKNISEEQLFTIQDLLGTYGVNTYVDVYIIKNNAAGDRCPFFNLVLDISKTIERDFEEVANMFEQLSYSKLLTKVKPSEAIDEEYVTKYIRW